MLDSGATNNARAIKKDENYKDLLPIEAEVTFDSEVNSKLFIKKKGTIVCPEEAATTVSMSEVVSAGYKVEWKEEELIVS